MHWQFLTECSNIKGKKLRKKKIIYEKHNKLFLRVKSHESIGKVAIAFHVFTMKDIV